MSTIYVNVRAKAGRIARVSPRGEFIPHDQYIPVRMTPYISRLLHHHGDIEKEPARSRENRASATPSVETEKAKD